MPEAYNLTIDFQKDWINILKEQLISMGFKPSTEEDRKLRLQYFNLLRKLIEPKPRKVLFSKELTCPNTYQEGLQLLVKKIENGLDVNQHLSSRIANLDYKDKLLNDWGIHHLHLGTELNNRNLITRTGPVLFARFDDNYAYFINVMEHGKYAKKQPWTMQKLVRIIHRNWPESIKDFVLKEVTSVSPPPSDNDIRKARKGGYNVLLQVDGVAYAPIGTGLTASGHSVDVIRTSDYYYMLIQNYENFVKGNYISMIEEAKKKGVIFGENIHFQLVIEDDNIYALETSTRTLFNLGPFN